MRPEENHHKIAFPLERDEDGWPPADVESLWAKRLGAGRFEIDSIPFFVRGIAAGDVVTVMSIDDSLFFGELVDTSGHSTIRIVFLDEPLVEQTCEKLENLGCTWEGSHIPNFVSVDVPPSVPFESLAQFLDAGETAERWEYEVGCLAH